MSTVFLEVSYKYDLVERPNACLSYVWDDSIPKAWNPIWTGSHGMEIPANQFNTSWHGICISCGNWYKISASKWCTPGTVKMPRKAEENGIIFRFYAWGGTSESTISMDTPELLWLVIYADIYRYTFCMYTYCIHYLYMYMYPNRCQTLHRTPYAPWDWNIYLLIYLHLGNIPYMVRICQQKRPGCLSPRCISPAPRAIGVVLLPCVTMEAIWDENSLRWVSIYYSHKGWTLLVKGRVDFRFWILSCLLGSLSIFRDIWLSNSWAIIFGDPSSMGWFYDNPCETNSFYRGWQRVSKWPRN